ncbi:MAG: hypothetical protein MZW92_39490 [Comamonadaceae bacterium]|nr:hypothetical protein [Comamonadaceae bacterium]
MSPPRRTSSSRWRRSPRRSPRDTGTRLRLVFGSSGNFARQIAAGRALRAVPLGRRELRARARSSRACTVDGGALYARGPHRACIVPHGSPLTARRRAATDLRRRAGRRPAAAASPSPIPSTRPTAARAQEALQRAGLWDAIAAAAGAGRERRAGGAVRRLAARPQGGIIALSLALAPGGRRRAAASR